MNFLLDFARGAAALAVFLYHIGGSLQVALPALANVFQFGKLGVSLFFVISGYVIAASAAGVIERKESATAFLKRRFLRIYPPFWCSVAVVVVLPYLVALLSAFKSGRFEQPYPLFLFMSVAEWLQLLSLTKVFMADGINLQGQFRHVNAVYWSLAIEFQFYLCVYAALAWRRFYGPIILAITLASLLLMVWPPALPRSNFLHFWPMFALGSGLFELARRGLRLRRLGPALAGLGLLGGGLLALAVRGSLGSVLARFFPSADLGFALLCAVLLWLSLPLGEWLEGRGRRGPPALRALLHACAWPGVISYSVYLLHGKLFEVPAMLVRQLLPLAHPLNPLLAVLATLALCALFHRFCERPFESRRLQAINDSVLGPPAGARPAEAR